MFQQLIVISSSLLAIIFANIHLTRAQSPTQLKSPSISSHTLNSPLLLYLPPPDTTPPSLTFITLNLCSPPTNNQAIDYQFNNILIVSNSSDNKNPSLDKLPARSKNSILSHQSSAGDYSDLRAGFASVSLVNSVGLWISIQPPNPTQTWTFQLGLSTQSPLHNSNPFPALKLDDTDDSNVLLTAADSSVFLPFTTKTPPSLQEFLPIVLPTPATLQLGLASSLCYLQSLISNQSSDSRNLISKLSITHSLTSRTTGIGFFSSQPTGNTTDHDYRISDQAAGLRTQYLISNLAPALNYSAWFFQPGPVVDNVQTGRLWPYINFRTKSSKNCRLVHDLPFCPSVAYAVPSPPSQTTGALVAMYNQTVSGHLANFQTVVDTYPCNNDTSGRYSFVTGCGDCMRAYTDWVCAMTMPRCVDAPPPPPPNTVSSSDAQIVFTRTEPNISRTPALTDKTVYPYLELPPCASLCTLVSATCPPLIGWNCPIPGVSLNSSYHVPRLLSPLELAGGQQSLNGFGGERALDRFGNVFCNALETDIVYARMGKASTSIPLPSLPFFAIFITHIILFLS